MYITVFGARRKPLHLHEEFPKARLRTYLIKKTDVSISDLTEKSLCSTTRCIIIGHMHLQVYGSGPVVSMQILILVLQLLNVVQLLNLLHLLNVVFVVWPSAPIFWLPVFLLPFRHVVLVVLEILWRSAWELMVVLPFGLE